MQSAFLYASKSDFKFLCPLCHLHDLISEVASLISIVSNLTAELSSIKLQLASSDHQIETPGFMPSATSLSTTTSPPSSSNKPYESDKKFNVVVYGIKEHPMGTSNSKRQQEDLQQVIDVFFKTDKSFLPQSIRDHHCLGKFKQALPQPRAILFKLNRTADVFSLISKYGSVTPPLLIKLDMTHQQRSSESLLLS